MRSAVLMLGILLTSVAIGGVEQAIRNLALKNPQRVLSHLKGKRDGKQIYWITNRDGKDSQGYLFYRQNLALMVEEVRVNDGVYYHSEPKKLGKITDELIRPEIRDFLQNKIAAGRARDLADPLSQDDVIAGLGYDPAQDARKIALIAGVAKELGLKGVASGSRVNRSRYYLDQQTFIEIQGKGGIKYARLEIFLANNKMFETLEGVSEDEIAKFLGLERLPNDFHNKAKKYLATVEIWQGNLGRYYVKKGLMARALDDFIAQNESTLKTMGYYNSNIADEGGFRGKNFRFDLAIPYLTDKQYNLLIRDAIDRGKLAISNNSTFSGKSRRDLSWLFWPGYTPEEQLGVYLREHSSPKKFGFSELNEVFGHFQMTTTTDFDPAVAEHAIKSIIHGTGVRGKTRNRAGGDLVLYLSENARKELGDYIDKLGVLDGKGLPRFRRPAYGKARDIAEIVIEND